MKLACVTLIVFLAFVAHAIAGVSFAGARRGHGLTPVIIVAGQSNAVGSAGTEAIPAVRGTPITSGYLASQLWKTSAWVSLSDDDIKSQTYQASPWPWFATEWTSALGRPVRVLQTSQGGTCLVSDKDSTPGEPSWDPDSGSYYSAMLDQVSNSGSQYTVRAVLWWQGECEITYPTASPAADYEAALEALAASIWDDLGVFTIVAPVSLRTGGPCGEATAGRIAIRTGTLDAAADSPYIIGTVVTADLVHQADNCAHFYDVETMGKRWFDAMDDAGLAY